MFVANRWIRVRQCPPDATVRSRRADNEMDLLVGVLLVSLSAGMRARTSAEGLKERSARGFYGHFDDEMEPYTYAAVPLHQPLPMLRLLSPSHKYKYEVPYDDVDSFNYYTQQPIYSASMIDPRVTEPSEASSDHQLDVIYARPSKRGGYGYRKQASSRLTALRPLRPYLVQEPVIFRVHKYKFVRDR